ncbi:MAG: formate dehydrogenase accessory sulfurtransferase FdhD [Actinobacteria bacterium]|nr:formate dehydrogenase accessory sulfurtransferase FdhD [Actinomycetota bacterium]
MDAMISWRITRFFRQGGAEEVDDRVAVESPLEIIVNGMPLVALMRLPGMDKELAVGFCLTEKVIESVAQVTLLKHCGSMERELAEGREVEDTALDRGNVVELEVESPRGRERFAPTYVVRTGCGGADLSALGDIREGCVASRLQVPLHVVLGLGEKLAGGQEVFRATGGTHGAGFFDAEGRALVVAEDVGRHNALDKAVGWCALRGIPLEDKLLMLSGRVSYEMALKAARVGIPVVVSLAAPTSLGLRVAERAGLTVVGFCGGERCNLYTHGWRVTP